MHTPKGNLQLKLQPMDLNLLLQGQQLTRLLTFAQPCDTWTSYQRQELHVWGQQISCYQLYHPQLHHLQRHHLASYHWVREAIAAKYISFHWKDGKSNPADILSKHWEFATVWPMLKPILFWRGETATQLKGSDRIPSTTPGAEPPRVARDSGSARSHSTHIETSYSEDHKWSPKWILRRYQAICLSERNGLDVCQISRAKRTHNRS